MTTVDRPEAHASSNGHAGSTAEERVLDALGNEFTPESLRVLTEGAIPPERAAGEFGVRAVRHPDHVPEEIHRFWVQGEGRGPGMLFEWRDQDRTVVQFRPDNPVVDEDGKAHKYVFPGDCGVVLNHLRPAADGEPVMLVEGTKQSLSAAVWAPEGWGVTGMSGCWGWRGADLSWCEGRKVVLLMDQDVHTNRDVYDAAAACKEALEAEGADEVVFARLAGAAAKDGLDDVLGRRAADRRTSYLERISRLAEPRLGRQPARRGANPYMGEKGLLARTASLAVLEGQPAALAAGSMIALYRDGAFRIDSEREPLIEKVKDMLGEEYRPNWRATIEEYLVGELYGRGLRLPDRMSEPLLNCANGMLDLKSGELLDHDPSYLSSLQIPVRWDPEAKCPVYEAWLAEVLDPHQAAALEEVAATMLDPSRTPQKALFGFGPSRSGKSTFLRILAAVAGLGNTSAVTLHQLADNKFMAANIYGKMLNVAADLSSAHVEDMSLFKMLTGEDPVAADRKYGKTFQFTNRALFAFSANDIPTVSETSRAYVQRIAPFRFSRSFAGAEKPEIEETILRQELPGVLRRWVGAWQAFIERGTYLPPLPDVADEFEAKSDRVARWAATRCDIHTEATGLVGPDQGSLVTDLYNSFKTWTKDDGGAQAMTRPKFAERLRSITGVHEVRLRHKSKNLGLNVTTHTGPDREIGANRANQAEPVFPEGGSVGECGPGVGSGVGSDLQSVGSVGGPQTGHKPGQPKKIAEGVSETYGWGVEEPTLPTPSNTGTHRGVTDIVRDPFDTMETINDDGPVEERPAVRTGPAQESGTGVSQPGRAAGSGSRPGSGDDAGGLRGPEDASPQGQVDRVGQRLQGADVPGGDPGAGLPGRTAVTEDEYPEDPFAPVAEPAVPVPSVLEVDTSGPLAFDIETPSAKKIFTYVSRPEAPFSRLNGALGPDGASAVTTDPQALIRALEEAPVIHAHNGFRFDLMALAWHHGADYDELARKTWDTYVDEATTDPSGGQYLPPWNQEGYYSLDQALERRGEPGKTDHLPTLAKPYGEAAGYAGKEAVDEGYERIPVDDPAYNAYLHGDLKGQDRLYRHQMSDTRNMDYRRREQRVAYLQNRMTYSGWKIDVPLLRQRVAEEAEKKRSSLEWLHDNCGVPLTETKSRGRGRNKVFYEEPRKSPLGSNAGKEALIRAFRERGLPYHLKTESGALALNKDALSEASYMVGKGAKGQPVPGLLNPARRERTPGADWAAIEEMAGHIRRVTTAVAKYQEIMDHLIGDRVHGHVGETQGSGRWAMVKPSVTNLGKRGGKVVQRAPFIADDGCVLIAFDLDQVDMRAFAGHCGDPAYVDMFVQGQDPHSMITNMVSGGGGMCGCPDKTRHTCEWRDRFKAAGHGWNYGLSINGLVNQGIERVLAEQFDAGMNTGYPDLCSWRTSVREKGADGQLLDNGFGRLMRVDPKRAYTQAPALCGQGTARDIMVEGLLRLPEEYIPWMRGVVHDEVIFNVPEDRTEECVAVVTEALTFDLGEVTGGALHSVPITTGASRAARSWDGCYAKD